jgi:hypothetical protein
MVDAPKYWFPAKRYGWGWGFPRAWQGWVVVVVYVALIGVGFVAIPHSIRPGLFIAYLLILTVLLTAVCWVKGEPPRWRWGKRNSP